MPLYSGKLLAILLYATGLVSSCMNNTSCDSCLDENCVWVPVEGCLETCEVIADTACYDIQFFPNNTIEDICILVENSEADSDLCQGQNSCDTCVETLLVDSVSTCQWFAEGGYCDSACGMFGCGDIVCSENSTLAMDCEDYDTCDECLEELCSWTPSVGCIKSCDVIADTSCFFSSNTSTIEETCMASEASVADEMICTSNVDCGTCVSTALADGFTTCQWFEEGAYCSSGCGIEGCGTTSCFETTSASRSPTASAAGLSADKAFCVGMSALIFIFARFFG
jgi:hypothetical protein